MPEEEGEREERELSVERPSPLWRRSNHETQVEHEIVDPKTPSTSATATAEAPAENQSTIKGFPILLFKFEEPNYIPN